MPLFSLTFPFLIQKRYPCMAGLTEFLAPLFSKNMLSIVIPLSSASVF